MTVFIQRASSAAADNAAPMRRNRDKNDGRARFMPHTGFTDPTTPPDAAPRESIELRSLVFHPN